MATIAPSVRQPFAALDSPRLHHLSSAKNRQNGLPPYKSSLGSRSDTSGKSAANTSAKRAFALSSIDQFDSENVDPNIFNSPSKKVKSSNLEHNPFEFTLSSSREMPPPAVVPSRLSTPSRKTIETARTPLTAPAGRSPTRKIAGISKSRRTSAPIARIDPPFTSKRHSGSSLPFSLDAALNSTVSASTISPSPRSTAASSTIQESKPSNWFFEIYEDTPEEEASNLMEHSTLILDLSSDEETSKKERSDMGKENIAPDDYDAPTASRPTPLPGDAATPSADSKPNKKNDLVRKKLVTANDMDDGQRSPLSDLETEPFFAQGLDKDAHVVVDAVESSQSLAGADAAGKARGLKRSSADLSASAFVPKKSSPLAAQSKETCTDDILIWEDSDEDAASRVQKADSVLGSPVSKPVGLEGNAVPNLSVL